MFVVNGEIYIPRPQGYAKCVLHKRTTSAGKESYYLSATDTTLSSLPQQYEITTFDEIVAKYGTDAINDDAAPIGRRK